MTCRLTSFFETSRFAFLWLLNSFVILLLLTACSPVQSATPPPTPQILIIARSLALQGWDEKIQGCAIKFPQLAVFVLDHIPDAPPSPSPGVTLQLGNSTIPIKNTYLIGWDDIILAANTNFETNELSLSQLQNIVTAPLPNPTVLESPASPVQFLTYPPGDETRTAFEQAILPEGTSLAQALIAPDPAAMLEALANNSSALGYLPASTLSQASADQQSQIKSLKINDKPADFFRQPVVASLSSSPSPLLNAYLQCLIDSGY